VTPPGGCAHVAVLFASDAELVETTAPFVSDGIAAGDLVLVQGPRSQVELLRRVFDDDPRVCFRPGAGPPRAVMRALADHQRRCERENAAGRGVRVTGAPPDLGDPAGVDEWMWYEAVVGRALAPYRFSGLCRYDTRLVAPDVLAGVTHLHQRVVTAAGVRAPDPAPATASSARGDRPGATASLVVDERHCDSARARDAVRAALGAAGIGGTPVDEFVCAVSEVVTNAWQHGRALVRLRLWADGRRWLCVVVDRGAGIGDPWSGVDSPLPGNPRPGGLGLWMARQMCERLTIDRSPGGGARVTLSSAF
jgi:anti-sigma regulatory factor (Ser/Thr protein kinase)